LKVEEGLEDVDDVFGLWVGFFNNFGILVMIDSGDFLRNL